MSQDPRKPAWDLSTPVQYLKGVGPQRAELLARLDMHTLRDVLFYFPRDYEDLRELRSIGHLEENRAASVCGVVDEVDQRETGPGRSMLGVLIRQENLFLRAVWFNQPYMRRRFAPGQHVLLSGTPRLRAGRWEMSHPRVQWLHDGEEPSGCMLPVYGLTEGIRQSQMRRIVQHAVQHYTSAVDEVFPDQFLDEHQLWPIGAALPQIHAPHDPRSLEQARRRFIYQELLVLQLALAMRRWRLTRSCRASAFPRSAKIHSRILRLFPFELTNAQRTAIEEIRSDMAQPYPMNRLLQGEVGSGKTVVAMYAMLLTVAHGQQAVLMAPTEVLARQHARTLEENLRQSRVRIGLLVGSLSPAQKQRTMAALESGELDLVVGTQAITQSLADDKIRFHGLGLVVIDEQHKFGVQQRAGLKQAALAPHYLVMTATPIPRTVSMTLFGDLDVSVLADMPPGRQPVHTYLGRQDTRHRWWDFFRKKLREGRQGYVITPLVDESDSVESASVEQSYEELANEQLEAFRVGLIHGRMTALEKDAAMESFRRGATQVLVATSVVEVGVDVPNATIMTVEGGERFGLAQLHQLRGRISRGAHPGYLCLFANPHTEEAQTRLQAFCRSNDGFELAEIDFRLRGPGDLFGVRQHGLPPLRIADLIRDAQLLETARQDAQQLIASDPELADPTYGRLRRMVLARYGRALQLGDVG